MGLGAYQERPRGTVERCSGRPRGILDGRRLPRAPHVRGPRGARHPPALFGPPGSQGLGRDDRGRSADARTAHRGRVLLRLRRPAPHAVGPGRRSLGDGAVDTSARTVRPARALSAGSGGPLRPEPPQAPTSPRSRPEKPYRSTTPERSRTSAVVPMSRRPSGSPASTFSGFRRSRPKTRRPRRYSVFAA